MPHWIVWVLGRQGLALLRKQLTSGTSGELKPSPQPGPMLRTAIAAGTAIVVILAFLTGMVPVELGKYPMLFAFGIGTALLGIFLIREGTGTSLPKTAGGVFALCGGLYLTASLPGIFVADAPRAFLEEKFPIVGVCQKATDLWEDRPMLPPPPDLNEIRERAGEIGTDIQGELEERKPQGLPFWGQTPTPTAVPSPTQVPTSTPTFLEGIIPGD